MPLVSSFLSSKACIEMIVENHLYLDDCMTRKKEENEAHVSCEQNSSCKPETSLPLTDISVSIAND